MTSSRPEIVRVTLRYFAQAREITGLKEEQVELSGKVRVQNVVSKALEIHPRLGEMQQIMRFIVNGRMTDENIAVKDGDVVVLLPPIAGGSQL
jgi:MoaD family protein